PPAPMRNGTSPVRCRGPFGPVSPPASDSPPDPCAAGPVSDRGAFFRPAAADNGGSRSAHHGTCPNCDCHFTGRWCAPFREGPMKSRYQFELDPQLHKQVELEQERDTLVVRIAYRVGNAITTDETRIAVVGVPRSEPVTQGVRVIYRER